jgi:hypothetical protein
MNHADSDIQMDFATVTYASIRMKVNDLDPFLLHVGYIFYLWGKVISPSPIRPPRIFIKFHL